MVSPGDAACDPQPAWVYPSASPAARPPDGDRTAAAPSPAPSLEEATPAAPPGGVWTLEWELSLDATDLRSHAWYHGKLGRLEAEGLLAADGDFLVRESASQPGQFVLSCRWNSNNIHFMVNKIRVNTDTIYETEQYYLEEEPFETIPHLITSYVSADRSVSAASGARIRQPVNRTAAIGAGAGGSPCPQTPVRLSWQRSLLGRGRRVGSAEQLPTGALGRCTSSSMPRLSAGQQPLYQRPGRLRAGELSPPPKPGRFDNRVYEEIDEPDAAQAGAGAPPATAAVATRVGVTAATGVGAAVVAAVGSGSDSGHGSGDSASEPAAPPPPPPPPAPPLAPVELSPPSAFDVASFETLLLPLTNNAPMDATALRGVTLELLEAPQKLLAAHLTWWDLQLIDGDGRDRGLGVSSGIELVTLPQGQQLRQDLLERSEWFSSFVIASIVSLEDEEERAQVISKWINVAIETKNALGNLYGFASIIQGLCSSQVQRLYITWHRVRQRFTPTAFEFDAHLAPSQRRMSDGVTEEAPNTCLPHLCPLAALLEEALAPEAAAPDQLQAALLLLSAGRQMAAEVAGYRRNGQTARAARPEAEAGTRDDMFRSEFHMRLLLGSRAAGAEQRQRRQVLLPQVRRVLTLMAGQRDPSPT